MVSRRRFLIGVPLLSALVALGSPSTALPSTDPAIVAFGFNGSPSEPRWVAVNDGVMGGVSSGSVTIAQGTLRFTGRIRLENNGGFASIRSVSVPSPANAALLRGSSLSMRFRSSATPFAVTLQTAGGWYWAMVTPTARRWGTVDLPYSRFLPRTRFGEPLDEPAYAGQPVSSIGVLIGNKRAEDFLLEIDSLSITNR